MYQMGIIFLNKYFYSNGNIGRAESAIGQVEKKLLKMFQKDFLSLLTIFR